MILSLVVTVLIVFLKEVSGGSYGVSESTGNNADSKLISLLHPPNGPQVKEDLTGDSANFIQQQSYIPSYKRPYTEKYESSTPSSTTQINENGGYNSNFNGKFPFFGFDEDSKEDDQSSREEDSGESSDEDNHEPCDEKTANDFYPDINRQPYKHFGPYWGHWPGHGHKHGHYQGFGPHFHHTYEFHHNPEFHRNQKQGADCYRPRRPRPRRPMPPTSTPTTTTARVINPRVSTPSGIIPSKIPDIDIRLGRDLRNMDDRIVFPDDR